MEVEQKTKYRRKFSAQRLRSTTYMQYTMDNDGWIL